MPVSKLTDTLSVSVQILPEDLEQLAADGFKTIICNRPDHEGPNQPDFNMMLEAAKSHGLDACYVPLPIGPMQPSDIADFKKALEDMPTPAVAYCKSGMRSAMLWAASQHGSMPTQEIVQLVADAGFDISVFMHHMDQST